MADLHPRLASFAPRPPTPPKERIENAAKFEQENIQFTTRFNDALDTPEESSSSSAEYFGGSLGRASKRVIFSPWTKYHKPPGDNGKNYSSNDQIRTLPPSRDCRSSKSILKPYLDMCQPTSAGELSALSLDGDITTMLESATQHLSSPSRNSRVDAYTALLGCLSTYEDVNDLQIVSDKLMELLIYIRRDVLARTEEKGTLDTQLITQALKFLSFLVSTPDLVRSLPDDFCSFIIDQSILSLEDQTLPKIVATHYMNFIAQQKLPQQTMNSDRMNRLITALDQVASNIKGNRIVGQRLMVYKRLLTQAKPAMVSCGGTWIGHLISGMLSTFKDIRTRAIMFGTEASLLLGTTRSVSQAFIDTLNRESPEGRKVVDFLASRLTEMVDSKDDGNQVPQIWSIVILFLRSRPRQLEDWQHLKLWLLIIQKCFNSSDTQIKFQANLAWSRLIFAVNLDSYTSTLMIKTLRQPIAPQLDRKRDLRANKTSKYNKQIARSSYCTLLYYAFRPSATYAQFDQYWDEYISQMLPSNSSINAVDINHSCDILTALFSSTHPRIWDENRANSNAPVKADELPCIDPKWVRSRSAEILKVFERLFQAADWQSRKDQEAPILLAWRSFGTAIGEAGRKEVKVSMETMTAIAQILNSIKQFWLRGLKQKDAEGVSQVIEKVDHLFNEAVLQIGLIPFNEKRLIQSSQNSYEATETPSSRSSGPQGPLRSPFLSLLNLLVSTLEDCQIPGNYEFIIEHLMKVSMRSTASRRTQISILRDFANLIPSSSHLFSRTKVILWQLIAKSAESVFRLLKARESHGDSYQYAGHDYKDAIELMQVGILLRFTEIDMTWQGLGKIIVQALEQEIGDGSVALVVTEPLAETISQSQPADCDDFLLNSAIFLLNSTKWTQSRREIERAHKLLWGASLVAHKQSSFDPFNKLYYMVNLLLRNSYTGFKSISPNVIVNYLSAVTSVVASCPPSQIGMVLKQIQKGVANWIEDVQGIPMISNSKDDSANISSRVRLLWAAISSAIKTLPKIDSQLLSTLNILIASGLNSRRKEIVSESILLWNSTFGLVEGLEYPSNLQPVLLKLRTLNSLYLPNFPANDNVEVCYLQQPVISAEITNSKVNSSPIRFMEAQIEKVTPHRHNYPTSRTPKLSCGIENDALARFSRGSPKSKSKKQGPRTTPKGRLRHDDSQIQFAAIESSPLAHEAVDSQLLTDSQKEFRERQEHEVAVMFPNLTSTSKVRSHSIDRSLPKLCFKDVHNPHQRIDTSRESPVLPVDESLSDFLGSSPTPGSNKRRSEECDFENKPLSIFGRLAAEPGSHHDENVFTPQKKIQHRLEGLGRDLIHNDKTQVQAPKDERLRSAPERLDGSPNQSLEIHWDESIFSEHNNSIVSMNKPDEDMIDAYPLPELDEFVDAHPVPLPASENDVSPQHTSAVKTSTTAHKLSKVAKESISSEVTQASTVTPFSQGRSGVGAQDTDTSKQGNGVNVVMNSFGNVGAGCFPNEDDQIAAQLVRDIEQAFSQSEAGTAEPSPISGLKSRKGKRKNRSNDPVIPAKKLKVLPRAQNIQVIIEAQKSIGRADDGYTTPETDGKQKPGSLKNMPPRSPSQSRMASSSISKSNRHKNHNRSVRSSTSNSYSVPESRAMSEEIDPPDVTMKPEPIDETSDRMSSTIGKRRRSARLHIPSESRQESQEGSGENVVGIVADASCADATGSSLINDRQPNCASSSGEFRQGRAMEAATVNDPPNSKGPIQQDKVLLEQMEKVHEHFADMKEIENRRERSPSRSLVISVPSTQKRKRKVKTVETNGVEAIKINRCSRSAQTDPAGDRSVRLEVQPAHGILDRYRCLLDDLKRTALGAEEEREMIGLLCQSLQEVHEAGRREKSCAE